MMSSHCDGGLCTLFDGFELGRDFASEIGMGGLAKKKIWEMEEQGKVYLIPVSRMML
jgi:hypothetical protein